MPEGPAGAARRAPGRRICVPARGRHLPLPQAGPGLLLRAESEHPGIDLRRSVTVGDAESTSRPDGGQGLRPSGSPRRQFNHKPIMSFAICAPPFGSSLAPEHYHYAETRARPVKIAIVAHAVGNDHQSAA